VNRAKNPLPRDRQAECTLVFDWTGLAFCCAVAGEASLRPTSLQEAQRSSVHGPLSSGEGAAMNTGLLITILVVVVIVVVLAVVLGQRRRTQRLQEKFGPEYQRTVARADDRRSAEADLAAREQRRRGLDIVALEPAA
jgi:hypothetical protein